MSRNWPFCLMTHSRCSCLKVWRRRAVATARSSSAVLASLASVCRRASCSPRTGEEGVRRGERGAERGAERGRNNGA